MVQRPPEKMVAYGPHWGRAHGGPRWWRVPDGLARGRARMRASLGARAHEGLARERVPDGLIRGRVPDGPRTQ